MIITNEEFNQALAAGQPVFVISGDGVRLRAAPSLADGTPIVTTMPPGAAFKLTGGFRVGFVEGTFQGQTGWAFQEFLATPGLNPDESQATVVSAEGLNLRSGPSLEAGALALMPNGATFALTGESRLGFLEGTFSNQHGWAFGEYLDPEGGGNGDDDKANELLHAMHAANMTITQGPFQTFSHSVCACYDFGIPIGTPIFPVANGTVIVSEATNGVHRPNQIVVQTPQLGRHRYAHLSERLVNVGDQVTTATLIGRSGTENGPHLHFALDQNVNPLGLTVTQILARQGFNVNEFPKLPGVNTFG